MNGIKTAIERAGGLTALGKQLGLDKNTVAQWKVRNRVPAKYCSEVEKLVGVPSEELNEEVDWAWYRKQCKCKK